MNTDRQANDRNDLCVTVCLSGGMLARRAPGALPCVKYLIYSLKFVLREVPQVDRTRPQTFSAKHAA